MLVGAASRSATSCSERLGMRAPLRDRDRRRTPARAAVVRTSARVGSRSCSASRAAARSSRYPSPRALGAPLDVVVPRKLGAPGQPELAIGAIAPAASACSTRVLIARLEVRRALPRARDRAPPRPRSVAATQAYRGDRPDLASAGRTAVVVDDGVATGSTALAAAAWARARGRVTGRVRSAGRASPTRCGGSRPPERRGRPPATPQPFLAVGQWYERFDQVTDEEVRAALAADAG